VTSDHFADWKRREALAEAMIPIIGQLYRERDVTILVHSRSLVNKSVISILKTHKYVRQIESRELSIVDTFPILQVIAGLDLGPSRIDIGKLALAYAEDSRVRRSRSSSRTAVAGATGENKLVRRRPRRTSSSTASAASAACWPGCWSRSPAPATACACAPSSYAEGRTTT
jgi:glyceraldehyde 3-phosphate dehydrogenase